MYLRKSRKDIEEEKKVGSDYDTLRRHRKNLLALIKRENYDLADEPFEEVVSGESIIERPRIQEMLKRVEAGEVDGVVVMDLDRLGRGDMLDQGLIDRAFRYSGTFLITPTEIYDPTKEEWELVFGIKSLVARGELKAITRRLQGGRKDKAKDGKSMSKKPPYGYLRDENFKLYPDEKTAWVVKRIFELIANGHGRQYVANELDKLNITPPNPKRDFWSPSMITAMIKNEVYKGDIVWGKFRYFKRHGKYHKRKTKPEEWIVHQNAHEPIVSAELWEKANASHSGRHRPPSINLDRKLSNPLAGILICAYCGKSILCFPRKNRRSSMLRCNNPACRDKQKSSYLDIVEERILISLADLVKQMEFNSPIEKDGDKKNIISINEKIIKSRNKELNELKKQKSNTHDLLEKGIYDIYTFSERQKILSERIKEMESTINQLKNEIKKEKQKIKNITEFVPTVRYVLDAYHHTDEAERKNLLLKSVIEKATYLRKKDWNQQDHFEIHIYPKI